MKTNVIIETIGDTFEKVRTECRRMYEKVTECFVYFHFIWTHDIYREWDYEYLYSFIRFKLERMGNQLLQDSFVEGHRERYEEIQDALACLDAWTGIEGMGNNVSVDHIREMYAEKQKAWERFHDILKDKAQGWWS